MGEWAKMTYRRFRWSEMRFETLYTTPLFGLSYQNGYNSSRKSHSYFLDGALEAMEKKTYCRHSENLSVITSLVSWVRLIEALHVTTRETFR